MDKMRQIQSIPPEALRQHMRRHRKAQKVTAVDVLQRFATDSFNDDAQRAKNERDQREARERMRAKLARRAERARKAAGG